jgi:hypothetical protein
VLAGFERGAGVLIVVRVGSANIDDIDRWILQQVDIAAVCLRRRRDMEII